MGKKIKKKLVPSIVNVETLLIIVVGRINSNIFGVSFTKQSFVNES